MTFAEKKIEEFRDKFCGKIEMEMAYEKHEILCLKDKINVIEFENWLKQTIAEAEREGMKKAYNDCSNNGGELPIEFHKFTENKIKELERE